MQIPHTTQIDVTQETNGMRKPINSVIPLALFYLFAVCYSVYTQRHFFADGSHFFLKILEEKDFIYEDDFARHHAHYFTQFIIVFLIKVFDIRDVDILSVAFGAGLYFPQLISLLICYFIARKHDIFFLIFPIIALFGIVMNVSFMLAHEIHVISNIFWPILFYLVFVKEYRWCDIIIVLSLAVAFTRCYEIAAILGTGLMLVTGIIIIEQRHVSSVKTLSVRILLLISFLVSIGIAVNSFVYPRDPGNKAHFLSSFTTIIGHSTVLLSFVYLSVVSIIILLPDIVKSLLFKFVAVVIIILTLLVGFIPVMMPSLTRPVLHYDARTFITIMLPLFSFVAFMVFKGIIQIPAFARRKIIQLVTVLIIGQTTWQILATSQWAGFREIFRNELNLHQGFMRFENTNLTEEYIGIQLIKPMTVRWTSPTLSILWSEDQDVKTVISSSAAGWEPFDPLKIDELPKVEEFGFSLEKYRDSIRKHSK